MKTALPLAMASALLWLPGCGASNGEGVSGTSTENFYLPTTTASAQASCAANAQTSGVDSATFTAS